MPTIVNEPERSDVVAAVTAYLEALARRDAPAAVALEHPDDVAWYAERPQADDEARVRYAEILKRDWSETRVERFEFAIVGERCADPGARWEFDVAVKQTKEGRDQCELWRALTVVRVDTRWCLAPVTGDAAVVFDVVEQADSTQQFVWRG